MMWGVILEYMPRPSVTEVKAEMDTHIALTNERWKETILRIKRLEAILIGTAGTTIVLLIGLLTR
tara:strand:+ start:1696 stop:1890 length:195 start_codon:yes stop_codon:yes gene_type:complete